MQQQSWSLVQILEVADQDQKGFVSLLDLQRIVNWSPKRTYNSKDIEFLLRMYDTGGTRKVSYGDLQS